MTLSECFILLISSVLYGHVATAHLVTCNGSYCSPGTSFWLHCPLTMSPCALTYLFLQVTFFAFLKVFDFRKLRFLLNGVVVRRSSITSSSFDSGQWFREAQPNLPIYYNSKEKCSVRKTADLSCRQTGEGSKIPGCNSEFHNSLSIHGM